jgi:hypothetical protein
VTRGTSVTLPDGTVLQLSKARVTVAPTKAAKVVKAPATKAGDSPAVQRSRLNALKGKVPVSTRQLGGGASADTELMTFAGDRKAVSKIYGRRGRADDEGDREVLGALVAESTDARVAATVQPSRNHLLQEYIDGPTGDELMGPGGSYGRTEQQLWAVQGRYIDSDDGKRLGIADYLMANTDRNDGNWIVMADGRVVGIDHGMAFGHPITTGPGVSPFSSFMADSAGFWLERVPVAPEDLAIIRRRIEALRPQFESSARGLARHKSVLTRLAALEKRATVGSPRLIAG